MLLGLGGLLAGMGVLDLQDAAHLVVGIILHPAVGIPHLRDTAHAVVGVGVHVTQIVHLLGGQALAVELVQSDFPLGIESSWEKGGSPRLMNRLLY